jgi:hypothetical protein
MFPSFSEQHSRNTYIDEKHTQLTEHTKYPTIKRSFSFILHNNEKYNAMKLQQISKHVDYKHVAVLNGDSIFKVF